MRTLVIQHAEPKVGYKYDAMLELTRDHHRAYCVKHGYDYDAEISIHPVYDIMNGGWAKIEMIQDALRSGYDNIIWLDADTLIIDTSVPLVDAIQQNKIGVCWHRIPQLEHWNVGALYISNAVETRAFVDEWLATPNQYDGWNEQGVFNRMARKSKTVVTLSDKWNATLDVSMVPDAVVLGFHGQPNRYELMKQTYNKLFPQTIQVMNEVTT
jgi:nucleotide-diphospho-sugar transferase